MSNHAYVPIKGATLSLYDSLNIKPPRIPQTSEYGYKSGKFNPTEQDMKRRLIFLLEHLTAKLKQDL